MRSHLGTLNWGAEVLAVLALGSFSFLAAACGSSGSSTGATNNATDSFLDTLHTVSQVASTVPSNGDVNPYGVAVVPATMGQLVAGDILVSNFNDKANVQGTGTTIVQVSPSGSTLLFANLRTLPAGQRCPGGIGLTTALDILPGGWVIVGSLATASGGALPNLQPVGCLIVLNDDGTVVGTITNQDIVGPWDMTVTAKPSSATVFVSNALGGNTSTDNGTPIAGNCTVVRLDLALEAGSPPVVTSSTVIGTDFPWRANKAALVLAPTGLALGDDGALFVDDTQTNAISAIPDALTRTTSMTASATTIASGGALNAPLGMLLAPNGDLVVVNGNDGKAVEVTETGQQVANKTIIKNGAGDLFGLTLATHGSGILFVNDGSNALDIVQP